MIRRRAYRYQIRPRGRAARLAEWAAATRYVWNYFLAQREQMYQATRELPEDLRREHMDSVSYYAQSKQLPALKAHKPFIADCPAIALVQVLRDLDAAWQRYFTGLADRPRFKGRAARRSITLSGEATFRVLEGGRRLIPAKLGAVTARGGRAPVGRPYRLTLSEDGGRWFASVGTELEVAEPTPPKGAVPAAGLSTQRRAARNPSMSARAADMRKTPIATRRRTF
jgi:putative transposase